MSRCDPLRRPRAVSRPLDALNSGVRVLRFGTTRCTGHMRAASRAATEPLVVAWLRRLVVALLLALSSPLWADAPTRIWRLVVFAYLPVERVAKEWTPLARELEQVLGTPVALRVLDPPAIETALARGEVDLLLTNPGHYIALKPQFALPSPHLTVVRYREGRFVDRLGATLIARRDLPLPASLHELVGKRVLIPGKKFFGGYQAFAYELFRARVDVAAIEWVEVGNPQEVLRRLAAGEGDFGVIRTSLWERFTREAPELVAPLTVALERHEPGFPFRVSSRLYPEWPLVILPHVPHDDAYAIISHLLALHLRIQALHLSEWLERGLGGLCAAPTTSRCAKSCARCAPPFTTIDFNWHDVWRQHRREAVLAAALFAAITALEATALLLSCSCCRRRRWRRGSE